MYDTFVVDKEGRCCGGGRVIMVSLHSLSIVDTQGVVTGMGMSVFVFEGFGWLGLLGLLAVWLLFAWLGVGTIQVPGRRR